MTREVWSLSGVEVPILKNKFTPNLLNKIVTKFLKR